MRDQLTSLVNIVSIAEFGCNSNFQNILPPLGYSSLNYLDKEGLKKTKTVILKQNALDSSSDEMEKLYVLEHIHKILKSQQDGGFDVFRWLWPAYFLSKNCLILHLEGLNFHNKTRITVQRNLLLFPEGCRDHMRWKDFVHKTRTDIVCYH